MMTAMQNNWQQALYERSLPLLKKEGIEKLSKAKVAVFGVGGVGSYAVEALARAGIGHFDLIDKDTVDPSNLNRQLCALHSTIGQAKVQVMKSRILDINPAAVVHSQQLFHTHDTELDFLPDDLDFIVDAIDHVKAKIDLIIRAHEKNIPIISAMGAGNKFDPTKFEITDIYKTYNDRLAKAIRTALRKANIKKHPVVFSPETPTFKDPDLIASLSFVPSVSGLLCASYVVRMLTGTMTAS